MIQTASTARVGRVLGSFVTLIAVGCSGSDAVQPVEKIPTAVSLSGGDLSFTSLAETRQLSATVRDQDGAVMTAAVSWTTSAAAVATVTSSGLVTAVANGSATITATAGSATASASAAVAQVATSVGFSVVAVALAALGDTVTVAATPTDANANDVPATSVAWASADEAVVSVTAGGLVTAVGDGATTISATAGGVSGSLNAFVGAGTVVITGVSPSPLVEGLAATVFGIGFSSTAVDNTVTLGGLPVQVTGASFSEIQITVPVGDCAPPREASLVVEAFGLVGSQPVGVTPETLSAPEVGVATYVTDGCLQLDGGIGSERYLVGILSTSETPSSLTPISLTSAAGQNVSSTLMAERSGGARYLAGPSLVRTPGVRPPLAAPAGPADLRPVVLDRSGEAEIREADRRLMERIDRSALRDVIVRAEAAAAPLRAVPNVGDTLDLKVVETSCSDGAPVRAVARYVGAAAVWLEDVGNPLAESFTATEYGDLDQVLANATLPTLTSYFGDFEDIDANGRIVVLVTKEVNKQANRNGFAFSGDLVPPNQCAASNQAEIFYGYAPDPTGTYGRTLSQADVLGTYGPLIAHETTHILQFTSHLRGTGGDPYPTSWELEGGATLAEQLVGYVVLGHGPGQDLGSTEWNLGRNNGWYYDWAADLASYFGYMNSGKVFGAPEQCSWVGRESEGNTGPCYSGRAPYGVPSTLLRFVLDEHGAGYAGGETGLMREITASDTIGFQTLTAVSGLTAAELLTRFAITLWADGRVNDWLTSWNVYDVFQGLSANTRLQPYTDTGATPSLDVSVRAGSNAYLEWTPPAAHAPTSLSISAPGGGVAPAYMVLWVYRIQ